jgi:hypothetical protein
METEFNHNLSTPFFLIVADHRTHRFCVEGPMTDDGPWIRAARQARDYDRDIRCGPKGPDRRALSIEFQRTSGFGGCPPSSILRPRE